VSLFLKISLVFTIFCVGVFSLGMKEIGPFGVGEPLSDISMGLGVFGVPIGVVLCLTALSLMRRKKESEKRG